LSHFEYSNHLVKKDEIELFDGKVRDSKDDEEIVNQLIITFVITNSQIPIRMRDKLFDRIASIWKRAAFRDTLIALCRLKAASSTKLLDVTGKNWAELSRALQYLRKIGLVHATQKVKGIGSRGGPKPTIWGIHGYNPEDIKAAIEEHHRITSPVFSEAKRLTQFMLDEYFTSGSKFQNEITIIEIQNVIRRVSSGYDKYTLTQLVASSLQEKGFKVWR